MDLQTVTRTTPWQVPEYLTLERDDLVVALDPEKPNWIATDARGARILGWLDGHRFLDEVASLYALELGVDNAKAAWTSIASSGPPSVTASRRASRLRRPPTPAAPAP